MRIFAETVLRGGKLKEGSKKYLTILLNRAVDEYTPITLTSAQKSRFHSWLIEKQIKFDDSKLIKQFTLDELFDSSNGSYAGPSTKSDAAPGSLHGADLVSTGMVGVDMQSIDEMFPEALPCDLKSDQALSTIFTLKELSYAASKDNPRQTLTGIFAAKEAVLKASSFVRNLNEIEILPDQNGRPICASHNLSISHSAEYAIAIAVSLQMKIPEGLPESRDNFPHGNDHLLATDSRVNFGFLRVIEFVCVALVCALVIYKQIQ
jgi:phosphopantetheine--protein transferase-like protein